MLADAQENYNYAAAGKLGNASLIGDVQAPLPSSEEIQAKVEEYKKNQEIQNKKNTYTRRLRFVGELIERQGKSVEEAVKVLTDLEAWETTLRTELGL